MFCPWWLVAAFKNSPAFQNSFQDSPSAPKSLDLLPTLSIWLNTGLCHLNKTMITFPPLVQEDLNFITFQFRAQFLILIILTGSFSVIFHSTTKMMILCSPYYKYSLGHFYKMPSNDYIKNHTNLTNILLLTDLLCAYFIFSYSSSFSRGNITLWMNNLRNLFAIVSLPVLFFYYFEARIICSIFSR